MAKRTIHIELTKVRELAALQCSEKEAASFFGISKTKFKKILDTMPDVLEAWEQGKDSGKISLRRKQFRLASLNATMAIHLGKNMLDQKDAVSHEHTGKDGGPIESVDLTKLDQNERNKLRDILLKTRKPEPAA